ncbi:MAG: hypothetical protein FJ197_08340 [Gammaproteobacteria bacterium]|nr:hypothetical protein [Gammaproteobacteria bacterium]
MASPSRIFGLERPELGVPWYDCRIVGLDGPRARGSGGVIVQADAGLGLLGKAPGVYRARFGSPREAERRSA